MFNNFKIAGSLLKFVTFGKSKLLRFITHQFFYFLWQTKLFIEWKVWPKWRNATQSDVTWRDWSVGFSRRDAGLDSTDFRRCCCSSPTSRGSTPATPIRTRTPQRSLRREWCGCWREGTGSWWCRPRPAGSWRPWLAREPTIACPWKVQIWDSTQLQGDSNYNLQN